MMDMILHKLMLFINGAQEGSTHRNLAIELVKLLTAIVALITAILLFLTENGLI